jgi:hypothetical protein
MSRSGEELNSLNASMVEQEGKIDSSPQKASTNQLFAGKHQNPFEIKQEMGFTNQLNSNAQKKLGKRSIKIIKN